MKLPGANYSVGVSSLGRANPGDPLAVGAAQANAILAQGAGENLLRASSIVSAWTAAEQALDARHAYAQYRARMKDLQTKLESEPRIKISELPPEVVKGLEGQVIVGDSNTPDDTIATWRVAPALYARRQKEEAAFAQGRVKGQQASQWLQDSIDVANENGEAVVQRQHVAERKAYGLGQLEDIIATDIAVGEPDKAIEAVSIAAKTGVISYADAEKRVKKIENDAANYEMSKLVQETNNILDLSELANDIYKHKGHLSDEQARMHVDRVNTKIKTLEAEVKHNFEENSKRTLAKKSLDIRIKGEVPSYDDLLKLESTMTGADFISLTALVDRKDRVTDIVSDRAVVKNMQRSIMALAYADPKGKPVDARARYIRDNISAQYAVDLINLKDRDQFILDVDAYELRATTSDPSYKQAEKIIDENIFPTAVLYHVSMGEDFFAPAISAEMKKNLYLARMQDPKTDAIAWVTKHLPEYTKRVRDVQVKALYGQGLGHTTVYDKNGNLDLLATEKAILSGAQSGSVSKAQLKDGINALHGILQKVRPPGNEGAQVPQPRPDNPSSALPPGSMQNRYGR